MRPVRRVSALATPTMIVITTLLKLDLSSSHLLRLFVSHLPYIVCDLSSNNAVPIDMHCFNVEGDATHP